MHTASKKSIIVSWLVKMEYIVCAHIIAFKTFDREENIKGEEIREDRQRGQLL